MLQSLTVLSRLLAASVILGLISVGIFPNTFTSEANITLSTTSTKSTVGDNFTVDVVLKAKEPINVFKGIVTFDPAYVSISSIDYNTSVADLWAEEPWYSNGNGTLTFIGGTTDAGGFTGSESIIRITFTSHTTGDTTIGMEEITVLKHDGIGSSADVPTPLETIFTITDEEADVTTIAAKDTEKETKLFILNPDISTDLNNDGKQNFADTSIFMAHLATQNSRSDFNQDGIVDLKDFSILSQ